MPNDDADCAAISVADVVADPPTNSASLEVSIYADLVIQKSWGCTSESNSLLMGRE